MRALLLETDPAYTRMLAPLFVIEDIELMVVNAHAKLVRLAPAYDLLCIDASTGNEGDLAACACTISRLQAPVYLFHPRELAVERLQLLVDTRVVWLPADFRVLSMRENLQLLKAAHEGFSVQESPSELTRREHEVRKLIVQGRSYRAIGIALSISKSTVTTVAGRIMRKLGVSDRKELVKSARRTTTGLHMVYAMPPEERTINLKSD